MTTQILTERKGRLLVHLILGFLRSLWTVCESTLSACLLESRHSPLRGTQAASQLAPAGPIFHYSHDKHT